MVTNGWSFSRGRAAPTQQPLNAPTLLPQGSDEPKEQTGHLPGPSGQHEPSWGGNRGRAGESWLESRRHPGGCWGGDHHTKAKAP